MIDERSNKMFLSDAEGDSRDQDTNNPSAELWNKFLEDPTSLTDEEWNFLAGQLDSLAISDVARKDFCVFRAEYQPESGDQKNAILSPQNDIKAFKKVFNLVIQASLSSEQLQNILFAVRMADLTENDYRDCISVVQTQILQNKDNEKAVVLEQLKRSLEAYLATALLLKFKKDDRATLPLKDIVFLDNHWDNNNNTYLGLNTFHINLLKTAISDPNYLSLKSKVHILFDKAEETLQKFIRLAQTNPEIFPEPFDAARTGGFITISVGDHDSTLPREIVRTRQIGGGHILTRHDPEYGTKGNKYKFFSKMKDLYALLEAKKDSGDTKFNETGVKGRIEFAIAGKKIGYSYSGLTQLQDQSLVVIAAHDEGMIDDAELNRWKEHSNNPYLETEFISALSAA